MNLVNHGPTYGRDPREGKASSRTARSPERKRSNFNRKDRKDHKAARLRNPAFPTQPIPGKMTLG